MQKIKSLMARQGLKSPQDSLSDLSPIENLRLPSKVGRRAPHQVHPPYPGPDLGPSCGRGPGAGACCSYSPLCARARAPAHTPLLPLPSLPFLPPCTGTALHK
uniref:Uncharacterized protein n=1 Tax=Vombatus ursinus TaxID=29139 RepID=A0A4X2LR31_VOMUR